MHVTLPNAPRMWLAPGIVDAVERRVTPVLASSYGGCAVTYGVVTDEGAFYADIPPSHLSKARGAPRARLADLVYRDCPSEVVWGGRVEHFRTLETARVFGRDRKPLCSASYLLTLDWHKDNWMCHVLLAHDGPVAGRLLAWPHFRILWGADAPSVLPEGYQKVREVWRVGPVG